jgi:beta-glucosidase
LIPETDLQFPPGFYWGAATAAHQVEGGNTNNDWWRWEQGPGRIADASRSGPACEQYVRFREDIALLAEMGHNAHRFSVEWSRIEPRPGHFDREALAHYRDVLVALRALGMEPFVTLHHFTNPLWFADAGGWLRLEAISAFERFVRRVVSEYRDLVRHWITINEPTVYAHSSYFLGAWPPGDRSIPRAIRVLRMLSRAHVRAYRAIKSIQPDAQVGLAHHRSLVDPARPDHPIDRLLAGVWRWLLDDFYLPAFARGGVLPRLGPPLHTEDFIGINYYTRTRLRFDPLSPATLFAREVQLPAARNALGWEIYPEGFERVITSAARRARRAGRPGTPIVITENGIADVGDQQRPAFLVQHLAAVHRALQAGARVIGYLHWSSVDNFEWAHGFGPRFGLIEVDYATQARHPKPSAHLYAEIIRRNAVTADILKRFAWPEPATQPESAPGPTEPKRLDEP